MNRTIKDATVKRFHDDSHDQLRQHRAYFVAAYNFARRLKTLRSLTPYEAICKVWTAEPSSSLSILATKFRDQTASPKGACDRATKPLHPSKRAVKIGVLSQEI